MKITSTPDKVWMLKHKSRQFEASMSHRGILFIEFSWIMETFGTLIVVCVAVLELVSGVLFGAYDGEKRHFYAYLLLGCLVFDSLLIHFPFSETARNFGPNNAHF